MWSSRHRVAHSPRWRSLPDIAHHAFKRFGAVLERTHAAVPVAVVGGGLRLAFRPSKSKTNREKITSRTVEISRHTNLILSMHKVSRTPAQATRFLTKWHFIKKIKTASPPWWPLCCVFLIQARAALWSVSSLETVSSFLKPRLWEFLSVCFYLVGLLLSPMLQKLCAKRRRQSRLSRSVLLSRLSSGSQLS